jgi:hypothetical protein
MLSRLKISGAMAISLAAVVFIAVGCGGTVIDNTKQAEALEANLKHNGEKVTEVECPSGVKVEKGTTFECSVKLEKGEEQTAELEVVNSNADVHVIDLRGSNE